MSEKTFIESQHEHFESHGYVRLGMLLDQSDLQLLRDRIDALMLGQITNENIAFQLDSNDGEASGVGKRSYGLSKKTLAHRRIDELHNDNLFLSYMQHPLFRFITQRYIGEDVSVFRSMFMNKPAGKGTPLRWHQDVGVGWGLDSNPIISVWTALDDATPQTGCMQIVPGSHQLGVLTEGHFTSEEDQAKYCTENEVVHLEAEAGEAILIHNWLLHRSGVNDTHSPRRAFSVAYMDGRTVHISTDDTFPPIFGKNALIPQTA